MFYRPEDGHGLPHNPWNALITPRPIGWISSHDGKGRANLAPYSFFNGCSYFPPQLMFACTDTKSDQDGVKDSVANIIETGVFCVNIVESSARDAMNISSGDYPLDVDEFELAGLAKGIGETNGCPYVIGVPAVLECKFTQTVQLLGEANTVVFGEVTGIHMRDDCIVDGKFDVLQFNPLARLGYRDYSVVTDLFSLTRPSD